MTEDRIERSIEIHASAEAVWQLISVPGWWINDGDVVEHVLESSVDDAGLTVTIVQDPRHGPFAVRTESLRAPTSATFRWLSTGAHDVFDVDRSTLVEFEIEAVPGTLGIVILRVSESGFAALPLSAAERRAEFDDNTEGWGIELAAAKAVVEAP